MWPPLEVRRKTYQNRTQADGALATARIISSVAFTQVLNQTLSVFTGIYVSKQTR